MADLKDEYGNPIQLTDEHGNPVKLTDEYGNPVHITGLATAQPIASAPEITPSLGTGILGEAEALKPEESGMKHGQGGDEGKHKMEPKDEGSGEIQRSSSSSSSSSKEDDEGQGGRRKKKGLKQKIKEKLTGSKHKEDGKEGQAQPPAEVAPGVTKEGEEQHEHEKKGVMDKIKDMLPGHPSH